MALVRQIRGNEMIVAILTEDRENDLRGCVAWQEIRARVVDGKSIGEIASFLEREFPDALPLLPRFVNARVHYEEGSAPVGRLPSWGLYIGPGKPPEVVRVTLCELGQASWVVKKAWVDSIPRWEHAVSAACAEAGCNAAGIISQMRDKRWPRWVVITGIYRTTKITALPMIYLPQSGKYLTLGDWVYARATGQGGRKAVF